ncbi:MAG: WYL domain-containing protein [Bacilli bacterium]|nr:WYL domain-containing protein [Bacilli bacterium]
MFLFKDGWYCSAYCEFKNDMRHFELKRIRKIELLSDKF